MYNVDFMQKKHKNAISRFAFFRKCAFAAGVIIQNVTHTFEKTQIDKMVFLWFFMVFEHKIHILHDTELKIAGNM